MHDFTLDELAVLVEVFARAKLNDNESLAVDLQWRIQTSFSERHELESLDFDDCLSCKL